MACQRVAETASLMAGQTAHRWVEHLACSRAEWRACQSVAHWGGQRAAWWDSHWVEPKAHPMVDHWVPLRAEQRVCQRAAWWASQTVASRVWRWAAHLACPWVASKDDLKAERMAFLKAVGSVCPKVDWTATLSADHWVALREHQWAVWRVF